MISPVKRLLNVVEGRGEKNRTVWRKFCLWSRKMKMVAESHVNKQNSGGSRKIREGRIINRLHCQGVHPKIFGKKNAPPRRKQ